MLCLASQRVNAIRRYQISTSRRQGFPNPNPENKSEIDGAYFE